MRWIHVGCVKLVVRIFKTHSGLRKHVKTKHQPEKMTFVCVHGEPPCNKRFCTRETLNVHLNKHKEGETYKCETCGRVFTYMYLHNLTRHLKSHPDPPTYKTALPCYSRVENRTQMPNLWCFI